jgi:cysteine desulfurase
VTEWRVDLLTICAHKFHAPKGIAALYIRRGTELRRLMGGAGHERGLRPGTENVLALIGLGQACQSLSDPVLLQHRIERMRCTRDRLYQHLVDHFRDARGDVHLRRNTPDECALPNTLNVSFARVDSRRLLEQLKDRLAFSTGSACHEHSSAISTTLRAIGKRRTRAKAIGIALSTVAGLSTDWARGTVRLSTSHMTTDDEIDRAGQLLCAALDEQLASLS